jgi:hypothetical protein
MFDDLKTYGIISVLLILILGYFVYVIYRDSIVLKNNMKELKELLSTEDTFSEEDIEEYDEHHHEHDEEFPTIEIPGGYTDLDEYFSHVTPNKLHSIQELEEPQDEPKVEESPKKKKQKKSKKQVDEQVQVQVDVEEIPCEQELI